MAYGKMPAVARALTADARELVWTGHARMPLVSVVISTHNRPEMLAEAIASVRGASCGTRAGACSTSATTSRCVRYAAPSAFSDPSFFLIVAKCSTGTDVARLLMARGVWGVLERNCVNAARLNCHSDA